MQAYLAAIPPIVLSRLPPECGVRELGEVDDIGAAAVVLARCDLQATRGGELSDMLHQMALTFAAAQGRLRQIRGRFPPNA